MRIVLCLAWLATAAVAANNPIDDAALGNELDGRNWAAVGRTFGDSHYSPLVEINRDSVARLGLAWTFDLDVPGATATPLAVDGVLYVAAGAGTVWALDARSGKLLWRSEAPVSSVAGRNAAAGDGTRGMAFWKGRLFVTRSDGQITALDAKQGAQVWSVPAGDATRTVTFLDAPRVMGDKVIVSVGDVAAFDVEKGEPKWRWHNPDADATQGATITVDRALGRIYVSSSAVVALDANNGAELWRHAGGGAAPPGGSASGVALATIDVAGAPRAVLLRASALGIEVIDRADGKSLSSGNPGLASGIAAAAYSTKSGLWYAPARDPAAESGKGFLVAWDPAKQRANWQQPTPGAISGATLATAGDLVFHGQIDGYVIGYDANTGRRSWQFYAATAALGAPITYVAGGKQQLTIIAGPPGAADNDATMARFGWDARVHPRRVLTFVLDGKAKLPPTPPPTFATPKPAPAAPPPGKKEVPADALPPGSLESTTPRS